MRSVAVQTAVLNDGYIARIGTHQVIVVLLLLAGPAALVIGGVSYGHYWRQIYAATAPDDAPVALQTYVALLFIGFIIVNFVVFPMVLKVLATPVSIRTQKRFARGAGCIMGLLVAIPMAACEMALLDDSDTNAAALGLAEEQRASVFALVALSAIGVFFVWQAYVNFVVDAIARTVRKAAHKMLKREGLDLLHQRPGSFVPSKTKYAIAVTSRRRAKRRSESERYAGKEMGTVSRPLAFSPAAEDSAIVIPATPGPRSQEMR